MSKKNPGKIGPNLVLPRASPSRRYRQFDSLADQADGVYAVGRVEERLGADPFGQRQRRDPEFQLAIFVRLSDLHCLAEDQIDRYIGSADGAETNGIDHGHMVMADCQPAGDQQARQQNTNENNQDRRFLRVVFTNSTASIGSVERPSSRR